jgi:hypothetical protein
LYLIKAREYINQFPEVIKDFRGCTVEQIAKLEAKLEVKLPEAYLEFLKWFGYKGGLMLKGSDVYYPYLIGSVWDSYIEEGIYSNDTSLLKFSIELLNQYNFDGEEILKNAIIIFSHQGTAFRYININDGENPKVYMFAEQGKWLKEGPMIWGDTFSDYLLSTLEQEVKAYKHLGIIK